MLSLLAADCPWTADHFKPQKYRKGCGIHLPDIKRDPMPPPDLPQWADRPSSRVGRRKWPVEVSDRCKEYQANSNSLGLEPTLRRRQVSQLLLLFRPRQATEITNLLPCEPFTDAVDIERCEPDMIDPNIQGAGR